MEEQKYTYKTWGLSYQYYPADIAAESARYAEKMYKTRHIRKLKALRDNFREWLAVRIAPWLEP